MRLYLSREVDEGWIIDLTSKGQTPHVPTRIFPGVRQQLVIGIFVRRANHGAEMPAPIHYRALPGKEVDRFKALVDLDLTCGWEPSQNGLTMDVILPKRAAARAFLIQAEAVRWGTSLSVCTALMGAGPSSSAGPQMISITSTRSVLLTRFTTS